MFEPRNERYAERVRASFARQQFMHTIGAEITGVQPGLVEIRLAHADALCQQHGYFHGGVIGTLADNAAGYAAFSLMAESDSVLTIEYKVNFVAPGSGEALARQALARAARRTRGGGWCRRGGGWRRYCRCCSPDPPSQCRHNS